MLETQPSVVVVVLAVLQAAMGVLLIFLTFILNGIRESLKQISSDLKGLNDKVLQDYVTRQQWEARNVHIAQGIKDAKAVAEKALSNSEVLAMKAGIELPRRS